MWVRSFPNVNYILYFQKATLASPRGLSLCAFTLVSSPLGPGDEAKGSTWSRGNCTADLLFCSHLTEISLACVVMSKTTAIRKGFAFIPDAEWSIQESHTPFTMHLPIYPANQNQCTAHLHATYLLTTNALSICIYMPCTPYGATHECYSMYCCKAANFITPQVERKNEWMKSHVHIHVLAFFFPCVRGPPEVWHHSWIQLSLKYLQ